MMNIKKIKTLLFTTVIGIGVTLFTSNNVSAATYKIQSGDSLYSISTLFKTTTNTLISDNKLSSNVIYPGQAIYVNCPTYTVKAGDSMYLIAKNNGISLLSLRKANNIWNDYINIGQVLNIPKGTAPTSVISYTASELDMLSRLINAESEGESFTAKVSVGAVVINRVQSSLFPNSIASVIYQKVNGYYQFTPVLNGAINKPATAESTKAAYAALSGQDPTNGALFFYDNTVTNTWLLSKPVSITVGKLIFAY